MRNKVLLVAILSLIMSLPVAMDQSYAGPLFGRKKKKLEFRINGRKVRFQKKDLKKYSKKSVRSGYLRKPTAFKMGRYGTMVFSNKRPLYVYENRKIRSGYLYRPEKINTPSGRLYLRENGYVSFYDTGMIMTASLDGINDLRKLPRVNGTLPVRSTISLYENGYPRTVYPARDVKIGKYVFMKGRLLRFREDGTVESGVLGKRYVIKKRKGLLKMRVKKKKFPAGKRYNFSAKGKISK